MLTALSANWCMSFCQACTSPEDGAIWVDGERVEQEHLVSFLRFELPAECYRSYFRKVKAA